MSSVTSRYTQTDFVELLSVRSGFGPERLFDLAENYVRRSANVGDEFAMLCVVSHSGFELLMQPCSSYAAAVELQSTGSGKTFLRVNFKTLT